jgi:hypothetical protein
VGEAQEGKGRKTEGKGEKKEKGTACRRKRAEGQKEKGTA